MSARRDALLTESPSVQDPWAMASIRSAPRKGENFELSDDLNSEYRENPEDAFKRVIASVTVQKWSVLVLSVFASHPRTRR